MDDLSIRAPTKNIALKGFFKGIVSLSMGQLNYSPLIARHRFDCAKYPGTQSLSTGKV